MLKFYLHGERVVRYAVGGLISVWNSFLGQNERDGILEPEGNSLQTVEEEKDQNVKFVPIQILQHTGFFLQFGKKTVFRRDRETLVFLGFIFLEFNIRHVRLLFVRLGARHLVSCLPHQEQYKPPPRVGAQSGFWRKSEAQKNITAISW